MKPVALFLFFFLYSFFDIFSGIVQPALNRIDGALHQFRNPLHLQTVKIIGNHRRLLQFGQFLNNSFHNLGGCFLVCREFRHGRNVIVFNDVKHSFCLFRQQYISLFSVNFHPLIVSNSIQP